MAAELSCKQITKLNDLYIVASRLSSSGIPSRDSLPQHFVVPVQWQLSYLDT